MVQPNPLVSGQGTGRREKLGQVDEFELMRRRMQQRGVRTQQERQQELSRQFASLGNLPSGSAIKARQQAATAAERATNEGIQNINVNEAQTLRGERESLAGRNLQRELQENQIGSSELMQERQIGSQEKMQQRSIGSQEKMNTERIEGAMRERTLIESGLDARQAKVLSQNKALFDIEMDLKERGQSFLEDSTNKEFDLNKSISALNAVNLLTQTGFGREEVAGIFQALKLPYADMLSDYFFPQTGQAAPPPAAPVVGDDGLAGGNHGAKYADPYILGPDGRVITANDV